MFKNSVASSGNFSFAQMQHELELYRNILDRSPIGTAVYHLEDPDDDRTLRIIYVNQAAASIVGSDPANMIGKTNDDLSPGIREQGITQTYMDVIRTGKDFVAELVYGDERLQTATYLVRAIPVPNRCLTVMFENITERKRAEDDLKTLNAELEQRVADGIAQLNKAQRTIQQIIDNAPAAIYAKDLHGHFLMANRHTSALLGLEPHDLHGKLDSDLFPPENAAQWRSHEHEVIASGMAITREELINEVHDTRYFLSIRMPLYDDNGQIYAVGGISTEITAQRQQENELRAFKAIADNAPDGVGLIDLQNNIRYTNSALRTMFGREDLHPGMPLEDLYPSEHVPFILHTVLPMTLETGAWQGEVALPRSDGSTWMAQHNVFLVRDEQGSPLGIANFLRDVTEQRKRESEHNTFQQQLIEAQRNALRELSTPLIPISDHVLIMPLIGTIDSTRAQMVMESLLEGVARHQAKLVILDITGVMVVDTQVAQAFIQAAQAVRLLGAKVMLTGIQPQIAQTLVHLGVDLRGIITRNNLQSGIEAALQGSKELRF